MAPLASVVYLAYLIDKGLIALKVIKKEKYDENELKAVFEFEKKEHQSIFIIKYIGYMTYGQYPLLMMEYANLKTLDIIAKQSQIPMPSYTLRAIMKQIVQGLNEFHLAELIHRDIKCENILLHCPRGSQRVYVKISDFGLAKKQDLDNQEKYQAGTLNYMAPEIFQHSNTQPTQKVDMYALKI
ncbi:MAG: hypothetical protein EZS28_018921 [Streblomastix strix]|uniref:mitogen-activated protein kinase kinase n=1 Tax=Streblomastix strix TaxID=222440 RepID=A0A5J4VSK6_9EUKA|nr:MAG: hypothetical protein EZS28_018921 [Streblomastix strix]